MFRLYLSVHEKHIDALVSSDNILVETVDSTVIPAQASQFNHRGEHEGHTQGTRSHQQSTNCVIARQSAAPSDSAPLLLCIRWRRSFWKFSCSRRSGRVERSP